jgi:hypothetical protein
MDVGVIATAAGLQKYSKWVASIERFIDVSLPNPKRKRKRCQHVCVARLRGGGHNPRGIRSKSKRGFMLLSITNQGKRAGDIERDKTDIVVALAGLPRTLIPVP